MKTERFHSWVNRRGTVTQGFIIFLTLLLAIVFIDVLLFLEWLQRKYSAVKGWYHEP